jgi:hypothetical protein
MQPKICTNTKAASSTASLSTLRNLMMGILLLMLLLIPLRGSAHQFSVNECKEASDFIKNAAYARDNGITQSTFLSRIHDDIEIIRAFPPQLRWFIHDDDDAKVLLTAASDVFQRPKAARAHQVDFFKSCVENAKATDSSRKIKM